MYCTVCTTLLSTTLYDTISIHVHILHVLHHICEVLHVDTNFALLIFCVQFDCMFPLHSTLCVLDLTHAQI
jgi:hypothetical protein